MILKRIFCLKLSACEICFHPLSACTICFYPLSARVTYLQRRKTKITCKHKGKVCNIFKSVVIKMILKRIFCLKLSTCEMCFHPLSACMICFHPLSTCVTYLQRRKTNYVTRLFWLCVLWMLYHCVIFRVSWCLKKGYYHNFFSLSQFILQVCILNTNYFHDYINLWRFLLNTILYSLILSADKLAKCLPVHSGINVPKCSFFSTFKLRALY